MEVDTINQDKSHKNNLLELSTNGNEIQDKKKSNSKPKYLFF